MAGYGPAVINGVMQYTSPSAMNTFESCNRKWWYKYVARLPDEKPSRAMIFGTAAHKRIEHYLTTSQDLLGPAERAGIQFIPKRDPALLVEAKTFEGVPLQAGDVPIFGSLDLGEPQTGQGFRVTDWKFTSKLHNKRTTASSLHNTEDDEGRQMLTYAEWVRLNFPLVTEIVLRHVHFQMGSIDEAGTPSGPFIAREVKTPVIDRPQIAASWERITDTTVAQMKVAAQAKTAEEVGFDEETCNKWHKPCPFIKTCPQGSVGLSSLFGGGTKAARKSEEQTMSIIAMMRGLQQVEPATVAVTAPEAANEIKKLSLEECADLVAPPAPLKAAPPTVVAAVEVAPAIVRVQAPPAVDGIVVKRGRGRPRKDSLPPGTNTSATPAPTQGPVSGAQATPDTAGMHIYVGCSPVGVVTQTLHSYMLELERRALESVQETLPDIRMSEKDGLKYGKYKAVLSQLARRYPPAGGHYLVSFGDERIDAVVSGLESIAEPGCIVRGASR